jgi:uncharacterized protein YxeA
MKILFAIIGVILLIGGGLVALSKNSEQGDNLGS